MNSLFAKQSWIASKRKAIHIPFTVYVTTSVLIFLLIGNDRMWHWFIIPTFVCGLLICKSISGWWSGELDLFDPKGLMGMYGWHYFFFSPLLFVYLDVSIAPLVQDPPDWRPWIGYLSLINVIGLIIFHIFHNRGLRIHPTRTYWVAELKQTSWLFLVFGSVALAAQSYYFFASGGIAGVVARFLEVKETGRLDLTGLGIFQLLGNSLPLLILMFLSARRIASHNDTASRTTVVILLALITTIKFLCGGLEGSRGATVYAVIWFAGIVHYFWRPLNRKDVLAGLAVLFLFMYIYGFYKSGGTDAIEQLLQGESISELESTTGRTPEAIILGDFGRAYVQSYLIYRLENSNDYTLRWGETYAMAILMRLPTWVWPERPIDDAKIVAGTDLVFGTGVYRPGNRFVNSSWVYGLAGEAMLNFGLLGAPLPFAIWGFLTGMYRRYVSTWPRGDLRWLFAPFMGFTLALLVSTDLELTITSLITNLSYSLLLIILVSQRLKLN